MAVKRRVIWVSDEHWARMGQIANEHGVSISQEIRGQLVGDWREYAPSVVKPVVAARARQRNRDAILSRISKGS